MLVGLPTSVVDIVNADGLLGPAEAGEPVGAGGGTIIQENKL